MVRFTLERYCPVDVPTRQAEQQQAEGLAAEEAERLAEWLRFRAVSPAIAELRTFAESIRKSVTALAMVLDFHGVTPNPARDRVQVRLPLEEPDEPESPSADHIA